jgi:plasmid maintenance system antidote protein VapI
MPMTPARLSECLALLRWSRRGLAASLGRPEATVRQWLGGKTRVPDAVAAWLETLAEAHANNPPPTRNFPLA